MKKRTLFALCTFLAAGFAVAPAHAQDGKLKVHVPFEFSMAGLTFSAGEYVLLSQQKKVMLRSSDGKQAAIVITNPVAGKGADTTGRAVFHCYARKCFLWQVWFLDQEAGRELSKTRFETEVAKQEKGKYFSVLGTKPEENSSPKRRTLGIVTPRNSGNRPCSSQYPHGR